MRYLLQNINSIDKSNEIVKIYKELVHKSDYKTSNIMILVPNSSTKLMYQKQLNLQYSEEIKITTYLSFIKKEITRFWPLITENCVEIINKTVAPTFIPNSLAQYIINDKVNKKRNLDGYFTDLTSSNRNISSSINININKGAQALIDFKTIGEKIYLSKKNKDDIMKFSYSQMNEIIDYYTDTLLNNAMIDDSLSIYLYNNYLMNNEIYKEHLKKSINYLIIDSLESSTTAEVDFIDLMSKTCEDVYIYFDRSKDYSVFNNIDMEYIYDKIIRELENNNSKDSISIQDIYLLPAKINLNEVSQLYNEMVEEASKKAIELINEGTSPRDIVIISPVNNAILDYQIKNILNKNKIEVFNTKKDKKIVDYPYASALLVATCIFYDCMEYVKEEEHVSFIEILLKVNRIKALSIYRHQDQSNEYQELIKHIKDKRNEDIKISEFLIRFYIDKMLNLKEGKENVKVCKDIIQESEVFTENIRKLGLDKNKDKEKIFIEALKTTINDFYSAIDIDEFKNSNAVIIATPYSYISHNVNRPIQIWVDIGSNAWNMKIEKDISNLIVLRKTFKDKKTYTDSMEENYKKYYLYNMIYNLLINTKEVYAYKSEYTISGYIQESILYGLLLKLVDREGEILE